MAINLGADPTSIMKRMEKIERERRSTYREQEDVIVQAQRMVYGTRVPEQEEKIEDMTMRQCQH